MNLSIIDQCARELCPDWMSPTGDAKYRDTKNILTKFFPPKRKLDEKERAQGRSEDYWEMSSESQWAEDKCLGLLDWDGD